MPVGLTFITKAYHDNDILRYAYTYEQVSKKRKAPSSMLVLKTDIIHSEPATQSSKHETGIPGLIVYSVVKTPGTSQDHLTLGGRVSATDSCGLHSLTIHADGQLVYEDYEIQEPEWEIEEDVIKMSGYSLIYPTARRVNRATMVIVMAKSRCGKVKAELLMADEVEIH